MIISTGKRFKSPLLCHCMVGLDDTATQNKVKLVAGIISPVKVSVGASKSG